jgi:fibro-slime domain-containing protein
MFGTGTVDAVPATEDRIPSGATADAATGAGWYLVNLNGLNAGTPNQGFLLTRSNNGSTKIGRDYNASGTTTFLACPTGAAGQDYYLSEDPATPGRSLLSTTPPSSEPGGGSSSSGPGGGSSSSVNSTTVRTFYFLPPNDPQWITATPYFWLDVPGQPQQPQRMSIDAARCGWYKAEFDASRIPSGNAYILRTSGDFTGKSTNRIGILGLTEDLPDWTCNSSGTSCFPTPFDFSKQFSEISSPAGSRNLFFVSEKGTWSATDPMINEKERCSYNFAAMIYDTDREVNCSFNPNNNTTNWAAAAFKKGIVQPTLDANRKLQFNASAATDTCSWANESNNTNCRYSNKASAPRNCIAGWNQQNFGRAWNENDTTNVKRCYDMPFQRSSAGLWEFNSNKLCRNGNVMDLNGTCNGYGGYLGGFFPDELQTRGTGDYTKCQDCDKKYSANGWQALSSGVNPWCYERAWRGTGTGTADLSSAQTTAQINTAMSSAGCTAELNGSTNNLYSNTYNPSSAGSRNFFFCFESHATFTYEPGQEFFFSGDDDVWIFINNRLALDIGGVHSAVPGYIKLDTIKTPEPLKKDSTYNIDIFFCERNLNQSNIRITTNMYFSQESSMYLKTENAEVLGDVCLARAGAGTSCEEVNTGVSKQDTLCGRELLNNLKYYIANRAGTAGDPLTSLGLPNKTGIVLDANSPYCEAKADHLLCYGGIKIYEAAGQVQVLQDEVVGLVGTWHVWANYVGPVNPKPPSFRVAEFTKNARVRVVWGTLLHSLTNAPLPAALDAGRTASTVAGRPVKVAFAVAAEESPGVFKVGMDRNDAGFSPGTQFTIAGSSFSGLSIGDSLSLPRSNLKVFADSLAQVEYESGMVHVIPPEGYLVLWVTGNFEAEDDARYSISASGSTSSMPFDLSVYQPRLRFVDAAGAILPKTVGSKPEGKTDVKDMYTWIGEEMERTLVAFDPTPSVSNPAQWIPCGAFCNFSLRPQAQTYETASISLSGDMLMRFLSGMRVDSGTAKFSFMGQYPVSGTDFAYFRIYGPSSSEAASARWDSLQFVKPPVPTPSLVEIYDRKGGGRGDSLIIVYDSTFYDPITGFSDPKTDLAKLPIYIQVIWDEQIADTIFYGPLCDPETGLGTCKGDNGKYDFKGDKQTLIDYWTPFLNEDFTTITLTRDEYDDSFSEQRIKTAGEGKILSWETFYDPNRGGVTTERFAGGIVDKIPAVVTSAKFTGDKRECGTPSSPCVDQITITISEPVKFIDEEIDPTASQTAFAYILRSLDRVGIFEVYSGTNDLPSIMRWKNSGTMGPATSGDSVVYLTFRAFKSDNSTAYTPNAGDSVRFLATGAEPSTHPFKDLNGNLPHPLEWGVLIEGNKRFTKKPIRIAEMDPNNQDMAKNALKGLLPDLDFYIDQTFFTPDRPIELLPVPEGWPNPLDSTIRANYPGTVGWWFEPNIIGSVIEFENTHPGIKVSDEDISFHARSYIHTNLGNFVVRRELTGENSLGCKDPIFTMNGAKSCKTGASGGNTPSRIYLAWNLKSAPVKKGPLNGGSPEGRLAGAGAYVMVYDFWWEINAKDAAGNVIPSGHLDSSSGIEMHGVKRRK